MLTPANPGFGPAQASALHEYMSTRLREVMPVGTWIGSFTIDVPVYDYMLPEPGATADLRESVPRVLGRVFAKLPEGRLLDVAEINMDTPRCTVCQKWGHTWRSHQPMYTLLSLGFTLHGSFVRGREHPQRLGQLMDQTAFKLRFVHGNADLDDVVLCDENYKELCSEKSVMREPANMLC